MTPPPQGAQVLKVGRYQQRLSQKPKFVGVFFEAFPNFSSNFPSAIIFAQHVIFSNICRRFVMIKKIVRRTFPLGR